MAMNAAPAAMLEIVEKVWLACSAGVGSRFGTGTTGFVGVASEAEAESE
jgi:hypothetical protein